MRLPTVRNWAQRALIPLAVLLFIDLFLDWHRASVIVNGAVDIDAGTSAWTGWGALAGIALLGLLVWEGFRFAGATAERVTTEVVSATLAIAAFGFILAEFFAGSTSVDVAGVVSVSKGGELWAAYAGLVLGALLAAAAVLRPPRPAGRWSRAQVGTQ
jgi:hypothetical protein